MTPVVYLWQYGLQNKYDPSSWASWGESFHRNNEKQSDVAEISAVVRFNLKATIPRQWGISARSHTMLFHAVCVGIKPLQIHDTISHFNQHVTYVVKLRETLSNYW